MHEYHAIGLGLERISRVAVNFTGAAIGNQQVKTLPVQPLEIFQGGLAHDARFGHFAHRGHVLVVADDTHVAKLAAVGGRKGGADGRHAVHGIVHLDGEAIVIDRVAGINPDQPEVFLDDSDLPAQAAGQFFHRHAKNFLGRDDFDAVRHVHQRKHRAVVVVQMRQEHRRDLVARYAAREQVLVEKRNRVDEQVVAVVTQRQSGAGLLGRKPGGAAEHLDAELGQSARHVIDGYRVGRFDILVLVQIDLDVTTLAGYEVTIDAAALDCKIAGNREIVVERNGVEERFDRHGLAVLVLDRERVRYREPLVTQPGLGMPALELGSGRAEQGIT